MTWFLDARELERAMPIMAFARDPRRQYIVYPFLGFARWPRVFW